MLRCEIPFLPLMALPKQNQNFLCLQSGMPQIHAKQGAEQSGKLVMYKTKLVAVKADLWF